METIIDRTFSECFYFGNKELKEDDVRFHLVGEG